MKDGSVFGRKEQCRHRAVGFGDDPEGVGIGNRIAAEQPEAVLEAQLIFCFVLLAQFAPVPAKMSREKFRGCLLTFSNSRSAPGVATVDLRETVEWLGESS